MSRTKKGSKGDTETWSKRPGSCNPDNRIGKKITIRKERMRDKEELIKIIKEQIEKEDKKKFNDMVERSKFDRKIRF